MFCVPYKSGCMLCIKLTPNASFNGFKGIFVTSDGVEYLKAYINVVPEKGKANRALISMLAKELDLPKFCFSLVSGEKEHLKKIYVETDTDISLIINSLYKEE